MTDKNLFPQQSPTAIALLALIAGNLAMAFGPWLVRSADSRTDCHGILADGAGDAVCS